MQLFINSPEIVETIGNENISPKKPDDLLYKNLFPELFIPSTLDEVTTFIGVELFVPRVIDDLLKDVVLHVYIFSHKDHLRTDKGYSRVDYLQYQVDRLLNGNKDFGIDNIKLKSSLPLYIGDGKTYRGKELTYIIPDINQGRCNGWE